MLRTSSVLISFVILLQYLVVATTEPWTTMDHLDKLANDEDYFKATFHAAVGQAQMTHGHASLSNAAQAGPVQRQVATVQQNSASTMTKSKGTNTFRARRHSQEMLKRKAEDDRRKDEIRRLADTVIYPASAKKQQRCTHTLAGEVERMMASPPRSDCPRHDLQISKGYRTRLKFLQKNLEVMQRSDDAEKKKRLRAMRKSSSDHRKVLDRLSKRI